MIQNAQIIQIKDKEIISFNKNGKLFLIENNITYEIKFKAILLGVLNETLIVLIRNRLIVSLDFPSLKINSVVMRKSICKFTSSHESIWLLIKNTVYRINSQLKIDLYDEFDDEKLCSFTYLRESDCLVYFFKNKEGVEIVFDRNDIPRLSLPKIFFTPQVLFETRNEIFFGIGRAIIVYNINNQTLEQISSVNPFLIRWNSLSIAFYYNSLDTEVLIDNDLNVKKFTIEGDVWKFINFKSSVFIFSDSLQVSLQIHKIKNSGDVEEIYTYNEFTCFTELSKHCIPTLKLSLNNKMESDSTAVFFIHGGPHQKSGNSWDPLVKEFLSEKYVFYIPQYKGTIGVEPFSTSHVYGIDDFNEILKEYDRIRREHLKVIVIGHSYGAFLALKLFCSHRVDLFFGINGLYDLLTISELNPNTYEKIHKDLLIKHSYCTSKVNFYDSQWHHIQFKHDPVISDKDLQNSLKRAECGIPQMHSLNFYGHGAFNEVQAKNIVATIKSIESSFYKGKLTWIDS